MMNTNIFKEKIVLFRVFKIYRLINYPRFIFQSLIVIILALTWRCESDDRFYRPNLPEKLCSIGIIDADDTARYISFEKSFQSEYPTEVNDSLREFSFTISSSGKELFSYQNDLTIKNLKDFKIPDSIIFNLTEKYYLRAKEKSTSEISAEITVPEPPSGLTLISINKEIIPLSESLECTGFATVNSAVISISFNNYNGHKMYYALLFEGTGYSMWSSPPFLHSGLLDFSVRECNTPGFFAMMQGLNMYHFICTYVPSLETHLLLRKDSPVYAYLIEGGNIPDNKCTITLSTQFRDNYSFFDIFRSFRIKLLSIPEELYQFEKSLYTYNKVKKDPFSEPIYLNGNIKGGNGVFAICRSTELTINLKPWY